LRKLFGGLLAERRGRRRGARSNRDVFDFDTLFCYLLVVDGRRRDLIHYLNALHHVAERCELSRELWLIRHDGYALRTRATRLARKERTGDGPLDERNAADLRL